MATLISPISTICNSFLISPVFSVIVGKETPKTYLLQKALLRQDSDVLAIDVGGGFKEEKEQKIVLEDEDSGLFGYFIEYMYLTGWIAEEGVDRNEDYIILARLYALGERLQAKDFQRAALNKFHRSFAKASLSDQGICDLLKIACVELLERVDEDPLRARVFWYAASRLTQLRDYDYFLKLLEARPHLGKSLVLLAEISSKSQPQHHQEPLPPKFVPESIY